MTSEPTGAPATGGEEVDRGSLSIPGLTDVVLIGEGGFGQVYRAHQPNFSRDVAVKVSRTPLHEATPRLRFERECRAMGMLSAHPNIVTVYESGFTGSDLPYLIMEYAAKGSLQGALDAADPLDPSLVLSIGVQLCGALETAHRAGVLHRDIKPDNVLLSSYGEPKLADFGLARLRDAPTTQTHRLTASLQHVPPELLRNGEPTVAGDICSLGSTLFQLLTGRPPYWRAGEDSIEPLIRRTVTEPPPDLRDEGVPDAVAAVITRSLDRNPERRPDSALAFGEELQEAQRSLGQGVTRIVVENDLASVAQEPLYEPPIRSAEEQEPLGTAPDEPRSRRRRRWAVPAGVIAVTAAAAGAFLALSGGAEPTTPEDPVTDTAAASSTTTAAAGPSTTLSQEAAAQLDFGAARFNTETEFCDNEPTPEYDEFEWLISKSLEPEPTGSSVVVSLRNKFGEFPEQSLGMEVEALVRSPDGTVATASGDLSEADTLELLYPESFDGGSTDEPGTYTVLWRDTEGAHIVCTGFVVA